MVLFGFRGFWWSGMFGRTWCPNNTKWGTRKWRFHKTPDEPIDGIIRSRPNNTLTLLKAGEHRPQLYWIIICHYVQHQHPATKITPRHHKTLQGRKPASEKPNPEAHDSIPLAGSKLKMQTLKARRDAQYGLLWNDSGIHEQTFVWMKGFLFMIVFSGFSSFFFQKVLHVLFWFGL